MLLGEKKHKLRKLLGVFNPSIRADLNLENLKEEFSDFSVSLLKVIKVLRVELDNLRENINALNNRPEIDWTPKLSQLKSEFEARVKELKKEAPKSNHEEVINDLRTEFKTELENLEKDLRLRVSRVHTGGQANRNILVASNPSTLSRYTDLNVRPGTNITLSYTNNDTLKTTDLTIAAAGGGTARSISTISVSSTLAATASTDIVIIASAGILLTLPTAASNTNLYTIKNTAASSVMVNTTASQTIDGSTSITLTTQYTAVDLVSDSSNWHVT